MEKTYRLLIDGAWFVLKGPLLCLLMVCIVVALVRHPPSRLSDQRAPAVPTLPPAP